MPRLEHIGIAVQDAASVAALYETLLGVQPYKQETVAREGVRTHFVTAGTTKLELLEALGPASPVATYLAKRGEGLHHLAFEVDDVEATMRRLQESGFTPLSDAPRAGADGKRIFFLHPKQTHGVLVEFCQSVPALPEPTHVPYRGEHLAVYAFGDPRNPPLMLLHGAAGASLLETEPLARRLEPYFFVLALDFAAHGASGDFAGTPLTLDLFADNVRAVLDHYALDRAHLFGFSMGGAAALYAALQVPRRVDRLVLHGANVRWDAPLAEAMVARLDTAALKARGAPGVERLAAAHGAARWEGLLGRLVDFTRGLPAATAGKEADLRTLAHPTLVSAGERDELFPLATTLTLYHTLQAAQLAVLPGAGHSLQQLDLDAYVPLVRTHLTPSA